MTCTSCHADDDGGRGPHGSSFAPILRERYDTAGSTAESYEAYALCYRCHDRRSILADESFRRAPQRTASGGGHSGHLAAGIACAACHDPHGVPRQVPGAAAAAHTHLINFDLRVAQPVGGEEAPRFVDGGHRAGSCTLVCHGVEHRDTSYR
jgi:hypothetical protein